MAERLDPLTLPLQGSRLIEASAGTGKTWTIAALVLRLVLGHAGAGRPARAPLQPSQILVMTFTRAATRELSDRIRRRLADAAAVFRGQASPDPDDAVIAGLLQDHPAGPAREHAAWLLAGAADAMDTAAIHTLDAWCQRVLREQEVDPAAPAELEVMPDGSALRLEAAQDVWRREIYPLDAAALGVAHALWTSPEALVQDLRVVGERALPEGLGEQGLAQAIEAARDAIADSKAGWAERVEFMQAWLRTQLQAEKPPLNGQKVSAATVEAWHRAMLAWLADPSAIEPALTEAQRRNLTGRGLRAACRAGATVDPPPAFDAFERLLENLAARADPVPRLRARAALAVQQRMDQLKALRGWRSHVDAQRTLADALDVGRHGEPARHLRERLRGLYPAALVDEFQDTSPLQLTLLDRLYGVADDDPATTLLLIGDPKQSIYGFRGADIHSYLRARRSTDGRHHVLSVNHRSAEGLVQGVQALFEQAEQRAGPGAFGFRTDAGDPLPFVTVSARGRPERLLHRGQPATPVRLCLDPADQNADEARERAAERCAQVIAEALLAPDTGFLQPDGRLQPLAPGDIAILVRTHQEAARMQRALERRRLPSVFPSDRGSIFATPEATELWRLLRAMSQPRDERRLREVMASALLGRDAAELHARFADEQAMDAEAMRLAQWQRVWRSQGVLAAIRAALHGWSLPSRWLQQPDGERRLTNVLQLSELLQGASTAHPGETGLLRWLARAITDPDAVEAGADEHLLRLESDADRIQVVTVHQSKGLEYPLVFLPFATAGRAGTKDPHWAAWPADDQGLRRPVLGPSPEVLAAEAEDAAREDTRLLYVALTRARHALWIGLSNHGIGQARTPAWTRSAIGRLLGGGPGTDEVRDTLRALADREPTIALQVAEADADPAQQPVLVGPAGPAPRPLAEPRPYLARFERGWGIHSYTALLRDRLSGGDAEAAAAATGPWTDDVSGSEERPGRAGPAAGRARPDNGQIRSETLRADEPWVVDEDGARAVLPLDAPDAGAQGHPRAVLATGDGSARVLGEPVDEASRAADAASADAAPWHRFPRGPLAGHFLHTQLEWLAGEGFGLARDAGLAERLARRCEQQGWGHRSAEVLPWLTAICRRPLPPLGTALDGLQTLLPEMEFWVPADGLEVGWLDQACTNHLLPGVARPPLGERRLRGLLMGFADLVFEHQGRYWVLDYKSNALGADDAAYGQPALRAAVAAHRYDVQAALYLLPLHRLLRARLGPAYDPTRDLGGAVFLFLRGIAGPEAGCCHLPPPIELLQALDARLPGPAVSGSDGDADAGGSFTGVPR